MDLVTPGIGLIFWATITFILLLLLLRKFAWKPILNAVKDSDIVIISGGSSFGVKDYTLKAIQSIPDAKIIAHGIAMRPAKHTLLAFIGEKPVIGLPGHPVSSATSFLIFAKPILCQIIGNSHNASEPGVPSFQLKRRP